MSLIFKEKYNGEAVEIVKQEHDWFDGHESYGWTEEPGSKTYKFFSNFNRREITKNLHDFVLAGFPIGSVGVCEEATGCDEDTGVTFVVSDLVGVYFDRSIITDEMIQKYHDLRRE